MLFRSVLGTVGYMSPEQVRGQTVDHRTDIFSFGAVLYELLTGRRAFAAGSQVETMNAILKEEPADLPATGAAVPVALERIVRHCLEKSPDERFASAVELISVTSFAFAGSTPASFTTRAHLVISLRMNALNSSGVPGAISVV